MPAIGSTGAGGFVVEVVAVVEEVDGDAVVAVVPLGLFTTFVAAGTGAGFATRRGLPCTTVAVPTTPTNPAASATDQTINFFIARSPSSAALSAAPRVPVRRQRRVSQKKG